MAAKTVQQTVEVKNQSLSEIDLWFKQNKFNLDQS